MRASCRLARPLALLPLLLLLLLRTRAGYNCCALLRCAPQEEQAQQRSPSDRPTEQAQVAGWPLLGPFCRPVRPRLERLQACK